MVTTMEEREAARMASGMWWIFLVTGLLWFVISLVVLRFNDRSVTTVGVIIGVVIAVACIDEFMAMALAEGWRWVHALLGVLFALGAIWCFVEPKEAFWALASVLGFLLIFKGTFDIIVSVMTKEYNGLWGLGLAVGILEILLGFWASQQYYPARAALILIWVGFFALFRGIGEIILAFRIRSAHNDLVRP
jgi:uncharacterized membrane protein HdeD (DUF308 family)